MFQHKSFTSLIIIVQILIFTGVQSVVVVEAQENEIITSFEELSSSYDIIKKHDFTDENLFTEYSEVLAKTYLDRTHHTIKGSVEKEVHSTDLTPIQLTLPDNMFGSNNAERNTLAQLSNRDPWPLPEVQSYPLQESSPKINRIKTVYFLTALETLVGQNTQIEDAFRPGKDLTGGGKAKNRFYGYQNVLENISNPLVRAFKGAQADDSGIFPNTVLHPAAGFTTMAYMLASGAKPKEAFAVSLANNILFEYMVEGTYVAPSGYDLLTTAGGSVLAYLSYKYLMPKKLESFYGKINSFKEKYDVDFEPTIGPTLGREGVSIGTKFVFKR